MKYDMSEARYYKKVGVVRAVRISNMFTVTTSDGTELYGNAHDYEVTNPDGTQGPVDPVIFRSTYAPVKPNDRRCEYFRKIVPTLARQHPFDAPEITLDTLEGPIPVRPGDWVMQGFAGEQWRVTDDFFQKTSELSTEPLDRQKIQEDADTWILAGAIRSLTAIHTRRIIHERTPRIAAPTTTAALQTLALSAPRLTDLLAQRREEALTMNFLLDKMPDVRAEVQEALPALGDRLREMQGVERMLQEIDEKCGFDADSLRIAGLIARDLLGHPPQSRGTSPMSL